MLLLKQTQERRGKRKERRHLKESEEEGTQRETEPPGLDGRRSILEKQRSPLPTEITTVNVGLDGISTSHLKRMMMAAWLFSASLCLLSTALQSELWLLLVWQYPFIVLHMSNF